MIFIGEAMLIVTDKYDVVELNSKLHEIYDFTELIRLEGNIGKCKFENKFCRWLLGLDWSIAIPNK